MSTSRTVTAAEIRNLDLTPYFKSTHHPDNPDGIVIDPVDGRDNETPLDRALAPSILGPTVVASPDLLEEHILRGVNLKMRANSLARMVMSVPVVLEYYGTQRSEVWMQAYAPYQIALHDKASIIEVNRTLEAWLNFVEDRVLCLGQLYANKGHRVEVEPCDECGYFIASSETQFLSFKAGQIVGTKCHTCKSKKNSSSTSQARVAS